MPPLSHQMIRTKRTLPESSKFKKLSDMLFPANLNVGVIKQQRNISPAPSDFGRSANRASRFWHFPSSVVNNAIMRSIQAVAQDYLH
jgi:hypothetical protein